MSTFVWINKQGKFLRLSESHTHTGHKITPYYYEELNYASVLIALPFKFAESDEAKELVKVAAWEERNVFIGVKPE